MERTQDDGGNKHWDETDSIKGTHGGTDIRQKDKRKDTEDENEGDRENERQKGGDAKQTKLKINTIYSANS